MSEKHSLPSTPLTSWLNSKEHFLPKDVIEHFLLQFQSPHTRRNYMVDVEDFFTFWKNKDAYFGAELQSITERHILLWLEKFSESSTRLRKLSSLSSFFKFCERRSLLPQNPCQLIKRPRLQPTAATQALNEEETRRLLDFLYHAAFEQKSESVHAKRQQRAAQLRYAVLHTLFAVGMRVDELCEMRISDLIFHPPVFRLRFVSKGGDEHSVIVPEVCAQVISCYLQSCRKTLAPHDFVFERAQSSKNKCKLSQTAVFKMIREAAKEAGINKKLSPHSARATVATVLHRQGVPLGFIQSLLNHKQITTTAHYVKKANERDESAALKAPVSDWLNEKK